MKGPALQWQLLVMAAGVVRKGRPKDAMTLTINSMQVPGKGWLTIGVESKAQTVEALLASHAHKNLGTFETLDAAMAAGQRYARKWLRLKKSDPHCECGDIS
jgi:hypothetical protein